MTATERSRSENRDLIISLKNVGISYQTGQKSDDFRSYVYGLLKSAKPAEDRKTIWPVRGINIEGFRGEILGIIGANGSGKTTICKLISGILKPDEGQAEVKGDVSALFSLGMGFNKELTGRENIQLNAMLLGISKKELPRYIEEIVEFSGLGEFVDRPVKTYSSGMRARLGFSIVAYMDPEILVLDEALNTGDLEFSEKASEKMNDLVRKAKMVVLVTHNIDYAERHCTRLIWLDKGKIRAEGDPSEVAELYRQSIPPQPDVKKAKKLDIDAVDSRATDRVVIEARDLTVTYRYKGKAFNALNGVNFRIHEGEVVGIIGHNGAGKSTLCKTMTRILQPDKGEMQVFGETSALLSYGIGFNPQLTGLDNIMLNGMMLGIPKDKVRDRIDQIVEFSGLRKSIDRPIKQYSAGMKARLGFSVAALLEPDILIIDEALSTGDMEFNRKASLKIQDMIDRAKAVVIVTHNMKFVEKVCTRAIWLKKGEIQFDGDSREAVRRYKADVKKIKQVK
jgi:teichoic acid transport system ATP-binding protein